MKYFLIAGEQSGDLHGSNLIKGIFDADSRAEIVCWGGDLMETAGARLLVHYKRTAFMGFVSVLKNLGAIKKNLSLCKQHITEFDPDVVIFIDYPGFNLRIAEFAKAKGFTTFWYISPKLWAWNEKRVEKIRKFVDRMFIIFPFEVDFYGKHGIEVKYYGNPLVDETERRISSMGKSDEIRKQIGIDARPVIGLLAGSRKHEIEHILPGMISIAGDFPEYQFVLAGVKNIPDAIYNKIIGERPVKLIKEKTYEILHISEAALVASGTATLEAALLGTPQVVCFKGDFFSMIIAWIVIRVKYISLVNLIMGREVVKELIQYDLSDRKLTEELKAILPGGDKRDSLIGAYSDLKKRLGPAGASERIAFEIVAALISGVNKSVESQHNGQAV
jgi:lipid-A-disaccharide synthase